MCTLRCAPCVVFRLHSAKVNARFSHSKKKRRAIQRSCEHRGMFFVRNRQKDCRLILTWAGLGTPMGVSAACRYLCLHQNIGSHQTWRELNCFGSESNWILLTRTTQRSRLSPTSEAATGDAQLYLFYVYYCVRYKLDNKPMFVSL